jgi:hypothetical protein
MIADRSRWLLKFWSIDSAKFWSAPPEVQQANSAFDGRFRCKSGGLAQGHRLAEPTQWLSLPEDSGCMILLR